MISNKIVKSRAVCMLLTLTLGFAFKDAASQQTNGNPVSSTASDKSKSAQGPGRITGTVKDPTGAIIPGAQVVLSTDKGEARTSSTDNAGRYSLDGLPLDTYTLAVSAPGFANAKLKIVLSSQRREQSKDLSLHLATHKEDVVVDGGEPGAMDADGGAGTIVLRTEQIEALPDDPDDLAQQLQTLATSAGGAPGGAIVTINGFLQSGDLPPKSAIAEIRINPDLYSAQYDRPPYRGGRIEIITKPGQTAFHGSVFFNLNDSIFNARQDFATSRAPSQTRRYGFDFSGPIVPKKSSFSVNLEKRDIDEFATVDAVILDQSLQPASFVANIAAPQRLWIGTARADWQINATSMIAGEYDFRSTQLQNQGVGGFSLPDHGSNSSNIQNTFRLTETTAFSPKVMNEVKFAFGFNSLRQVPLSSAPAISVPGAFQSGGNSSQFVDQQSRNLEFDDTVMLVRKTHTVKIGMQFMGMFLDLNTRNNFNGTFIFGGANLPPVVGQPATSISGLEQYRRTLLGLPGGVPTTFNVTSGNPDFNFSQWWLSGFVQDEWRVNPRLTLGLGLRYEIQTSPTDSGTWAPRLSIAYALDKGKHWVVRLRSGLFYDRIDYRVALAAEQMDGLHQVQTMVYSPSFASPLMPGPSSIAVTTIEQLEAGLRPPPPPAARSLRPR